MKKKMYEKIMDQCDKILADKYERLAEVEARIADKEEQRDRILQKMETLKESGGTFDEYNQEKEELSRVSFQLDNLKEWRNHLDQEQLIPKEEYETLIAEGINEVSAEVEALAAEVTAQAEKLYEKGAALRDLIIRTNQAFQHLQNDIFKNQDQPKDKHGDPITIVNRRTLPAQFWTVVNWSCLAAENYAYELTTGHKITEPKPQGKHWSNTAEEGK